MVTVASAPVPFATSALPSELIVPLWIAPEPESVKEYVAFSPWLAFSVKEVILARPHFHALELSGVQASPVRPSAE